MSDHLPPELIFDILCMLPVKSIIRFKSVSKSWHSLLEKPLFLDSHRKQTNKKSLIIQIDDLSDSNPTNFLMSDFESIDRLKEFAFTPDPDLGRSYSRVNIIGSCNGLVALSCTYDRGTREDLVIWNISTTERQTLPGPLCGEHTTCFPITRSFGFGYDSVSDSYKIVKLIARTHLLATMIYNLKINHMTWSLDDYPDPDSLVYERGLYGRGLLFEESLHWVSFLFEKNKCSLVGFGLEKDELYQVPLPDCVERKIAIGVLGTCLSMTNTDSAGDTWVWVMNKYMVQESWTKIYRVDVFGNVLGSPDGDGILLDGRGLYLYDIIKKESSKVAEIPGCLWDEIIPRCLWDGLVYEESFTKITSILGALGGSKRNTKEACCWSKRPICRRIRK